ncbi:MAG: 50S ribosomal protein L21 [SAR324 cluster bacterium]|nr:50S ribosomal protein L21 [SAR324 cluster bacterium]
MFAIIESGSRQYRVAPQSELEVDRLALEQGGAFETDRVLLLQEDGEAVVIGAPFVSGVTVRGTVVEHFRGRKIIVFKQKRRQGYRRKRGHRQELTRIRIEEIRTGKAAAAPKETSEAPAEAPVAPETIAPAEAVSAEAPQAAPAAETAPEQIAESADAAKPEPNAEKTTMAKTVAKAEKGTEARAERKAKSPAAKPKAPETRRKDS